MPHARSPPLVMSRNGDMTRITDFSPAVWRALASGLSRGVRLCSRCRLQTGVRHGRWICPDQFQAARFDPGQPAQRARSRIVMQTLRKPPAHHGYDSLRQVILDRDSQHRCARPVSSQRTYFFLRGAFCRRTRMLLVTFFAPQSRAMSAAWVLWPASFVVPVSTATPFLTFATVILLSVKKGAAWSLFQMQFPMLSSAVQTGGAVWVFWIWGTGTLAWGFDRRRTAPRPAPSTWEPAAPWRHLP
jgi:hypothetical protein